MSKAQPEIASEKPSTPSAYVMPWHQIVRTECEGTGVTRADVFSDRRTPRVVEIKNRVAKLLRSELHWSLPKIGRFLHKDHSTIHHAIQRPRRELDSLPPLYAGGCSAGAEIVPVVAKPPIPVAAVVPRPPEFTPEQNACREASDLLIWQFGPNCYGQNLCIKSSNQMHKPPFEGIVK